MTQRLLTGEELAERLNLYAGLAAAYEALAKLSAALPEKVPEDLAVRWQGVTNNAAAAVDLVCRARWTSLREAALAGAKHAVAEAEARVKKFEAGEDV